MKRNVWLAILLLLTLLAPYAGAYEDGEGFTRPDLFTDYPELEDGFLAANPDMTEFVFADRKLGRWIYISPTLRVEIERVKGKVNKRQVIWYESEIWLGGEERMRAYCASPEKPGKTVLRPEYIAQMHRVVYAQNGDYFTYRIAREFTPGIVLRAGEIICDRTYTRATESMPPLDQMAIYPDGTLGFYYPTQMTSQDYLNAGVQDVFSFGPILIDNGVIDERVSKKKTKYGSLEPRSAFGYIGPGHYAGIYVEGRNDSSAGSALLFVAQRLLARGCTHAFNLDGGQTGAMVFMGDVVHGTGEYNGYTNTRSQPDIIGVGFSEAVKIYTPAKKK